MFNCGAIPRGVHGIYCLVKLEEHQKHYAIDTQIQSNHISGWDTIYIQELQVYSFLLLPSLSSLRLLFLFCHYWRQTLLPSAVWQVVQPILTRPIQARTTVDLIAILSTQLHIIFSAHNHNIVRIRLVCRTCLRLKSVYRLSEGKSHFLQPLTGNIVAAARHALHISFQSFRSQYLRFASAVEVSYQKSFNVFGKRTNRNPKQNRQENNMNNINVKTHTNTHTHI